MNKFSDILKICRLCLVEEKVNHAIFEESGDLRSIFLKISSCLPVSVNKDDGLPEKICDTCSTKLDSFYQFWNETANAEKQLLHWLSVNKSLKQNQIADTSKRMETPEVKQEEVDPIDMSSDAQTYILQQQQLPYAAAATDSVNTSESEEPISKRPRRASAVKALEQMESEDEDDPDNYAKSETDESEKDEEEEETNYQENPSTTSVEDQPGPSGLASKKMVLDDTPVITSHKTKPCHVVLNNIQHLLDKDGTYIVPGRSRRNLTCYRCFKKFDSAESLEVHKAEHEPESEEEYVISDSEIEIESESDEETQIPNDPVAQINSKSPLGKTVDLLDSPKTNIVLEPVVIEYVPRPAEPIVQKQVQVVEPIRAPANSISNESSKSESGETKKVPVLCNIQIRCLTCDILFTNSDLLMKHEPLTPEKPCCFTCKVCSQSYDQPQDYLTHIMQHNTFSTSRYGYRSNRKKPEFRCTYCRQEFEHRFLLMQHERTHHTTDASKASALELSAQTQPKISTPTTPKLDTAKPDVQPAGKSEESSVESSTPKPKIWVIKEALMKSPEPPACTVQKTVVATIDPTGVKRKLDESELIHDMLKPGKKGRPCNSVSNQASPLIIVAPTEALETTSSLTCDICFDVFRNKVAYDEHMVFHNTKKTTQESPSPILEVVDSTNVHPCSVCNLHFKSAAGLKRHQVCAHENKKITSFVCALCSKIFSSRKGLNMHRNTCN